MKKDFFFSLFFYSRLSVEKVVRSHSCMFDRKDLLPALWMKEKERKKKKERKKRRSLSEDKRKMRRAKKLGGTKE